MIIQPAHMSLKAMVLLPGMQAEGCHGISAVGLLLSLHYSLACPSKPVKWHMEQYKKEVQICCVGLPAGAVSAHEGIFEPAAKEAGQFESAV